MQIEINKKTGFKMIVPAIRMANDFFKCTSCGYTVRMLVLGNTATCSQCGGRMERT